MFRDNLHVEEIGEQGGRPVYKLTEPLTYVCEDGTEITIPKGFESDMASVPRLPLVWLWFGDRAHRSACLHDYLYRRDAVPQVTRAVADGVFREAMISTGHTWKVYWPMWLGVRIGGAAFYCALNVADSLLGTIKRTL